MKKFKIILIIILSLIVILFLGLFIFLKTLDINRFKDQITQRISESINREVSIKDISFKLSIKQGVTIRVSGFSVDNHPDFSSEPMFYVDSAHLNIDALSLIMKHQIFVSKIEFDSPKLNIIRNEKGEYNIQKFFEQINDQNEEVEGVFMGRGVAEVAQIIPSEKKDDIVWGDFLIRSIKINNGTVIFVDRSLTPTITVPITEIDLQISNLSFDTAVPFNADASLWSKKKNIHSNGLVWINAQNQQLRIDDLKVETNLSDLLLEHVSQDIPSFKNLGLKESLSGNFVITIHQMVFGEDGVLVLLSEGQLTDGKMQFEDIPLPVESLNIHVGITESDLVIEEISLSFASGEFLATGQIVGYLEEQKFIGDLNISDVRLKQLVMPFDLPIKIEGIVNGYFKGSGEGMSKVALKKSLIADGTIELINGRIADVNLLKETLSKLSFFPDLVNRIETNLPEKYKKVLNRKDTILGEIKIDLQIHSGVLMIDQAEVNADGFLATAHGQLDLNQNLSLKADFYVESELSNSMVNASEELRYLLDENKQIHISFKPYNGKLENFRMVPDVGDLGAVIIRNRGREELRKVIFKALGLDERPVLEPSDGQEVAPEEQGQSPEEALIENILDLIPIFQ